MLAVRDSETAARAIGFNPVLVKTAAFALSALFTGLAGGLFASLLAFVAPSSSRSRSRSCSCSPSSSAAPAGRWAPWSAPLVIVVLPELISGLAEYRLLVFGAPAAGRALAGAGRRARHAGAGASAARPAQRRTSADFDIAAFLGRRERQPLAVEGLTIAFGGVRAATDVALTAEPGRVTALIGPNGAGKTTVLNMIGGFYRPDAGSIRLGDARACRRSGLARRRGPASPAPTRPPSCSARSACSTTC